MCQSVFPFKRWNPAGDVVVIDMANAHAVYPAGVVGRAGFGIDGIEHVFIGDEDATDTAELVARLQVVTVLIKHFQAMIASVSDPEAAFGIEIQGVWSAEITVIQAQFAPCLLYTSDAADE